VGSIKYKQAKNMYTEPKSKIKSRAQYATEPAQGSTKDKNTDTEKRTALIVVSNS